MSEILKQQIADARALIEKQDGLCFTVSEYGRILTQLEIACEALEFYADPLAQKAIVSRVSLPTGQIHNVTTEYEKDAGSKAKHALEEMEKA